MSCLELMPERPQPDCPKLPLNVDTVMWIAAYPDAEVRNHLVTLAYWEMSRHLDPMLHRALEENLAAGAPRKANANWFTVATWAISTVGRNIRSRELPRRVDQLLPNGLRRATEPWVLSMRSSAGRRVARALGDGRVVVFVSAMMAAIRFIHQQGMARLAGHGDAMGDDLNEQRVADLDEDQHGDLAQLLQDLAELVPGFGVTMPNPDDEDPTVGELLARAQEALLFADTPLGLQFIDDLRGDDERLQDFMEVAGIKSVTRTAFREVLEVLAKAFRGREQELIPDLNAAIQAYARASVSEDATVVAQEVFRGNLIIAAVEQVLLDRAVTTVVDHVPREFEEWVEGRASVWLERSLRVPRRLARLGTSRRLMGTQRAVRESWARLMSDQILVIALPTETVRIGRDIPPPSWRAEFFPQQLWDLNLNEEEDGPPLPPDDPVEGSRADRLSTDALFELFDRSQGDGRGTGAWDWRRFDERMNFAANLFRSRQQEPTLFWQPYNEEDCRRIAAGLVPLRTADPFEQQVVTPSSRIYRED